MCTPLAAIPILGGMQAAQSVVGYMGEKQAAEDQQKYQNKVYSQTAKAATENYLHTLDSLNTRFTQDTSAASETAQQNAVAGAQARGTAATAAGEAGVEGNSVQLLLHDFSRIEATNNANLYSNLLMEQQQMAEEAKSARAQAQSQVAQAAPSPVHQPSFLGAALQIGTTAFDTLDKFQQQKRSNVYDANNKSGRIS